MASLYEIDNAIMNCIDAETGEAIDEEALDALLLEREQKIENVALWVKNLTADAAAYKAEKEVFAEREKQAKAKAESLKAWLAKALDGQAFKTAQTAVSFRASAVVVIDDIDTVPEEFRRIKTTIEADKVALKDRLKEGDVAGCHLEQKSNITVK